MTYKTISEEPGNRNSLGSFQKAKEGIFMIVNEVSSIFLDNIVGVGRDDEATRSVLLESPAILCGIPVDAEKDLYITHDCLWLRDVNLNSFPEALCDTFLEEMAQKHPEYSLKYVDNEQWGTSYWQLIHRNYPDLLRYALPSVLCQDAAGNIVESCMMHIITAYKDSESAKNIPSLNVGKANSKFDSGFVGVASKLQKNHNNQIDDPNREVDAPSFAGVRATTPVAKYFLSDGYIHPDVVRAILESQEKHSKSLRIMTIIGALLCLFLPIIGNAIVLNKLMDRGYIGGLFSLSFWRVMLLTLPLAFLGIFLYSSVLGH